MLRYGNANQIKELLALPYEQRPSWGTSSDLPLDT
jgi:hypothetical protein